MQFVKQAILQIWNDLGLVIDRKKLNKMRCMYIVQLSNYRGRIELEDKAKVVASDLGTESLPR